MRCSRGQVASGSGFGGADMGRGCRAAVAASSWPAGVARGGLARSGEKGSAWRGAAERAKAVGASVSARRTYVPITRSARAPGMHGTCSTLCQSTLEVAVEAGN